MPVLANVYLYYVPDQWYEIVLKKYAKGEVYYVRYADDFLRMFQYEWEAAKMLELLRARLAKFGLEVAEDKTRILPIKCNKGTKDDFDFLGVILQTARIYSLALIYAFGGRSAVGAYAENVIGVQYTFYNTKTRGGKYRLGVRTWGYACYWHEYPAARKNGNCRSSNLFTCGKFGRGKSPLFFLCTSVQRNTAFYSFRPFQWSFRQFYSNETLLSL